MAESQDSGVEELLLHGLQPIKAGKVGRVHFAEAYEMVCQEEATRKVDGFVSRSEAHGQTLWTQDALVICMHMNDEHRKAV
ncbi:hypothetical protein GCM10010911_17860 [Paenibacillus nasutitermitis]|uniref:Uncharacterized protein n=1 Tax=Paenibacillus nasutitermitis TaxID=1652958 RepID=A0A917DQ67_9BACL|nr:hypothetical protein GCM10010911_17860 [Paenibacillus nasutitermitis]